MSAGAASSDEHAGVQAMVRRLQLGGVSDMPPDRTSPGSSGNVLSDTMRRTFSWSRKAQTKNTSAIARARRGQDAAHDRPTVEMKAGAIIGRPSAANNSVQRVFSFSRKAKGPARQSAGVDDSMRSDGDLERSESLFARAFSSRKGSAQRPIHEDLSAADHMHSPLIVRRLTGSRRRTTAYCVYYKASCAFAWYAGSSEQAVHDSHKPEGSCTVAACSVDPRAPSVFYVQGLEGETLECRALSAEAAQAWLAAFTPALARSISGYVLVSGKRGWKRRWVLFQPACSKLRPELPWAPKTLERDAGLALGGVGASAG